MNILEKLDELHAAGKMQGFTIWPTRGGYQANLTETSNAWRIRIAETPSAAVAALFEGGPLELTDEQAEMVTAREIFEPPLEEIDAGIFD